MIFLSTEPTTRWTGLVLLNNPASRLPYLTSRQTASSVLRAKTIPLLRTGVLQHFPLITFLRPSSLYLAGLASTTATSQCPIGQLICLWKELHFQGRSRHDSI